MVYEISYALFRLKHGIRYDINIYNPLFDGLQMIPTSGKSSMVEELEAYLKEDANFEILSNCLFRQILDLAKKKVVHAVFDSYHETSLKEATRQSRFSGSSMQMSTIRGNTPVPVQMDKFWSCSKNKELFQKFVSDRFALLSIEHSQEIVLSGMALNGEQLPAVSVFSGTKSSITDLLSNVEEATVDSAHILGSEG